MTGSPQPQANTHAGILSGGKPGHPDSEAVAIWLRKDGEWKLLAFQATAIPKYLLSQQVVVHALMQAPPLFGASSPLGGRGFISGGAPALGSLLSRCKAAIHSQIGTGYPAGLVTGQESNRIRNVIRRT